LSVSACILKSFYYKSNNGEVDFNYFFSGAEGDPTTEDPLGTGPPSPTTQQQRNGTTAAYCQRNNCCAMYTWPGNELYQNNPENEVPTSCDSLPAIQGDRGHSIACFDPIIYSNSTLGARPGPEIAIDECTAKDYPCFCSTGAEGVCIKLSFIRNTASKEPSRTDSVTISFPSNQISSCG